MFYQTKEPFQAPYTRRVQLPGSVSFHPTHTLVIPRQIRLFLFIYFMDMGALSACMSISKPEEVIKYYYRLLWATLWEQGVELRTSRRAASVLNCWATSLALTNTFFSPVVWLKTLSALVSFLGTRVLAIEQMLISLWLMWRHTFNMTTHILFWLGKLFNWLGISCIFLSVF